MRKGVIVTAVVGLLLVLSGLLFWPRDLVIGELKGPELDYILIDDVRYEKDFSDAYQDFTAADKGRFLGIVTAGDKIKARVYSVKADEEGNYLYVLYGYDGCFYVKEDIT